MKTNQAFEILKNAGGIQAARIMTKNKDKLNCLWVHIAAIKLRRGVPVAKIIHEKWFYGLPFYTNKYTLDPRPDSETLVEAVIKQQTANSKQQIKILDLGTGTGCLIAAIAKNIPNATGVAIDKSYGAVRVARRNMKSLGLADRIKILCGNFTKSEIRNQKSEIYDVIISNPPYIAYGDARVNADAMHDPKMALYAKNNGLSAYESIAKNARAWLAAGGKIYLEIGIDMGGDVREIFTRMGWKFENSWNDLSGIERVLCFSAY